MAAPDGDPLHPRPAPEVTVTGGPVTEARAAGAGPARGPLLAVGVLVAAAAALAVAQEPLVPPPAEHAEPSLRVVGERISTTRSGVLVVPVEVGNPGPAARVESVTVWAEPVRSDPAHTGATRVPAADGARLVAIVEPDCRLLRPGSGIEFVATVALRLRTADGARLEPVLDLGRDPAVVAAVRAACRGL